MIVPCNTFSIFQIVEVKKVKKLKIKKKVNSFENVNMMLEGLHGAILDLNSYTWFKKWKDQKHASKPSIDTSFIFIFIFYTNYYTVYVKLVPIKCKIKSMDLIILFSKFSKNVKIG